MYRAIERFADLEDNKYIYDLGMIYPRKGYEPTDERLKELSSSDNKAGKPVIEFFEDPVVREDKPKNNKNNKSKKK